MLSTVRRVSAFTHNKDLSALLFLYREVVADRSEPVVNHRERPLTGKSTIEIQRP